MNDKWKARLKAGATAAGFALLAGGLLLLHRKVAGQEADLANAQLGSRLAVDDAKEAQERVGSLASVHSEILNKHGEDISALQQDVANIDAKADSTQTELANASWAQYEPSQQWEN